MRTARRTVLTSRQRSALFSLPQREAERRRHDTLSEEELQNVGAQWQHPRNKLGFGRVRSAGRFIGRQLGPDGDELADYLDRLKTGKEIDANTLAAELTDAPAFRRS